jgi:hypothetical protein
VVEGFPRAPWLFPFCFVRLCEGIRQRHLGGGAPSYLNHSRRKTPTTTPRSIVGLKSTARTRIGAMALLAGWNRT